MNNILCLFLSLSIFGCCPPGTNRPGDYDFYYVKASEKTEEQVPSEEGTNKLIVGYQENGSNAVAESIKLQINRDRLFNKETALPHELFKAGNFLSDDMVTIGDFDISVGVIKSESNKLGVTNYDLGINLKGPDISIFSRQNLALTYCIDVSYYMGWNLGYSPLTTKSKIVLVKEGLKASLDQMKNGDIVNIVLYDDQGARELVNQYVHGSSDLSLFISQIDSITTSNDSATESGLKKAYDIAQQYFDSSKSNRILLIFESGGYFDNFKLSSIASNTKLGNKEGILLSILGFNYEYPGIKDFAQAGQGNYYIATIDSDVEHIFSKGFLPLFLKFASNLKIEISYPSALTHSIVDMTLPDDPLIENTGINFGYNTTQYYLERFAADSNADLLDSEILISVSYVEPMTNAKKMASQSFLIKDLLNKETDNIKDALAMVLLTDLINERIKWDDLLWYFDHVLFGHNTVQYKEYRNLIYQFANKEIKE